MLKLWGRPNSTNTQRVLWTLAEAGLSYELILASGTTGASGYVWQGQAPYGLVDTDGYRAMNPNGTIPTLDDGGFVLWESIAIVVYLARKYAPHLCGAGEEGFARALRWMIWVNHAIDPATHTLILHLERYPVEKRSPAAVDAAREEWVRKLALLEAELDNSRWFAGDAFTIGDIPLAISVQRFLHFGLEHPPMPRVADWMARVGERGGFRRHVAPREHHLR